MIASLGMYDWPEQQLANDKFWTHIANALRVNDISGPAFLDRDRPLAELWADPDLLIGQTCGLPLVSGRCGSATVIARAGYAAEHAQDGTYASALICRANRDGDLAAFRGSVAAVNEYGSQSGCNALADAVQPLATDAPFFGQVHLTGAHRRSAQAVADGQADIAAIDAVAWDQFANYEPEAHARLRVVGWTRSVPGLPFIVGDAHKASHVTIIAALFSAVRAVNQDGPQPGMPTAIWSASADDYAPVAAMARRVAGMRLAPDAPELTGLVHL